MAFPEGAHSAEIWTLARRHSHEVHPVAAAPRDLPRRINLLAVGIKQQSHHHPRIVGRLSADVRLRTHDRRQIQRRLDKLPDNPSRMAFRNKVVERRKHEKNLACVPVAKGLAGHPECCPEIIALNPYLINHMNLPGTYFSDRYLVAKSKSRGNPSRV